MRNLNEIGRRELVGLDEGTRRSLKGCEERKIKFNLKNLWPVSSSYLLSSFFLSFIPFRFVLYLYAVFMCSYICTSLILFHVSFLLFPFFLLYFFSFLTSPFILICIFHFLTSLHFLILFILCSFFEYTYIFHSSSVLYCTCTHCIHISRLSVKSVSLSQLLCDRWSRNYSVLVLKFYFVDFFLFTLFFKFF